MATALKIAATRSGSRESIELWRYERLAAAGYQPDTAMLLAGHCDIDLHRAVQIAARGCPEPLALGILL
jgi:hypothetical protein